MVFAPRIETTPLDFIHTFNFVFTCHWWFRYVPRRASRDYSTTDAHLLLYRFKQARIFCDKDFAFFVQFFFQLILQFRKFIIRKFASPNP